MEESLLYVTHMLNGILMLAIPIGLGIYLTRRFQSSWRLWWIGAATFVLSQVGHIPFNLGLNQLFKNNFIPTPPLSWILPFNALVLGFSAGLWEEFFRYFTYRFWAKEARSWQTAILLGAGHGGMEAILLGVLLIIAYFQMLALQGVDPSSIAPPEQVEQLQAIISQYWSIPWYSSLLGAIERIFTLPAHLTLSVLVWQVFRRAQIRWVWLAVCWHAMMNAVISIVAQKWGPLQAEGILGIFALINIAIIIRLHTPEPETSNILTQPLSKISIADSKLKEIEETSDQLDQTRYN